jgi:hypothetical protein
MKTSLLSAGLALFAPLASGCDDIYFGDPWDTATIHVSGAEVTSELDALTSSAPNRTAIRFHWAGFVAEYVSVEQCLYDCENQNDDFCWRQSDDYIEKAILPRQERGECPGILWEVGACDSFADCNPDSEAGPDFSQMIEASIDYDSVPKDWFLSDGESGRELEDGGFYAVGVYGFDLSSEPAQQVFGCRMFHMVDGQPIELHGTEK